jgi:ComF family protein
VTCRICPDWPRDFAPVRSACFVDPALTHLVHQFKYHGWRRLAESFARPMVPLLAEWPPDAVLVPIPLAARRRRMRGYNQAEELAAALGRLTGRLVRPALLQRLRETGTQTRLGRADRLANLAEAFRGRATARPAILVDDVFTTGATLVSAARALLDAGAPAVGAVTLARAAPPLAAQALRLSTNQ